MHNYHKEEKSKGRDAGKRKCELRAHGVKQKSLGEPRGQGRAGQQVGLQIPTLNWGKGSGVRLALLPGPPGWGRGFPKPTSPSPRQSEEAT